MKGSEDAHQDGLGLRPFLRAVAIRVFSGDHGWPDHSFSMVIVGRDSRMAQESEEFMLMPFQPLHKSFALTILIGLVDEFLKALLNESRPSGINLGAKRLDAQSKGILHKPLELLGEVHPLRASVKHSGPDHVSEQMEETPLLQKGPDLVIGPEEVANQHSLEKFSQDRFKDRGGPGGRNQVISHLALCAGKAPKPVGFAQNPPSGFIDMEKSTGSNQQFQRLIPGQKDLGQSLPSQTKTARRNREV